MRVENEPITVLYVNDDPNLLELLVTGLEREVERLTVRTATSAQQALDILDDEPIDCILSDHHMPEQTGVEFLRTVRAENDQIPFIMFTETGSESVASAAISAGVTDYIIRETLENQHPLVARRIVTYVERRRVEERATEADERLHELADMSNDVLWTFAADWDELLFVNAAYESVFGRPAEALRAAPESFLDLVHPDDHDRVKHLAAELDSVLIVGADAGSLNPERRALLRRTFEAVLDFEWFGSGTQQRRTMTVTKFPEFWREYDAEGRVTFDLDVNRDHFGISRTEKIAPSN